MSISLYWIYDFPNWVLGVLTVAVFVVFSVIGLLVTRPFVRQLLNASSVHNDVVSYIFAGVSVFYGLALGLIAVATWSDYTDVDGQLSLEAAAIAELYRDFDGYPEPTRSNLEGKLRQYTSDVIKKDWPAHRIGVAPESGTLLLDTLENEMLAFEPVKEREKIAHAEALSSLDAVIKQQRLRLQSVSSGLPVALWSVVLIGAWLTIGLTYLFWVENLKLHLILVGLLATFIALLVFLTAAMDNPFRGEFSVSPDAFQQVLDNVMQPTGASKAA